MTRPELKGWCPSAYVPMPSGDGLLVRIKPAYSQLTATALLRLAELSDEFGNGLLDLTSRANLQIRGVSERHYPALLAALKDNALIQPSQKADLLNVMLAPFTNEDSLGWRCASAVYAAAEKLPGLPAKFGFCIDCGDRRFLTKASGDLWIEQAADGGLLLRCAGQPDGLRTDATRLIDDLLKLTDWYQYQLACRPQTPSLRMRGVLAHTPLPHWAKGTLPQADETQLVVGKAKHHFILSAAYGQLCSQDLRQLAAVNKDVQFTADRLMVVSALPDNTDQLICQPGTDAFIFKLARARRIVYRRQSAQDSWQTACHLLVWGRLGRQFIYLVARKGVRHLDRVISAWLGWTADLLSLTGVVHGIHHREPACHIMTC